MLRLVYYIVFIISVAMAALGIILAGRLKNRTKSDNFSSLIYFQVFIYTFGFYGIWGQVIIKTFLTEFVDAEHLSRLSDISMLLGLPFLVFAWLMLLQFSSGLSGRRNSKIFVILFIFINFVLLAAVGYYATRRNSFNAAALINAYYIISNLIIYFFAAYLIHLPLRGRAVIHEYDRKIISPVLFLVMIFQCFPLVFYSGQSWLALLFIFAHFVGSVFLPVYLSYGTMVTSLQPEQGPDPSFEGFCRKFEVSPRESEIIREICSGLSNKEISEKLFISLQTVKDHTHRIYIKTNVKSRVQLITLVKEEVK